MDRSIFNEDGTLTAEEEARRAAHAQAAMAQAGEREEEYVEPDYFGIDETRTAYLPGSRSQFVVIKVFSEGDRRKFLDRTNRDVKLDRGGSASFRMAPGSERHELLKIAIVGWSLLRDGRDYPFNPNDHRQLDEFLTKTSPSVIDHIVKEVHKANPWLLSEMTVEDIEKEIANLQEMLETKKKEEALQAQF